MFVYVGCYTKENERGSLHAHGKGIQIFEWKTDGSWENLGYTETTNPAVLSSDQELKNLYCVNTNTTQISSFSINDETREIQFLNEKNVAGKHAKVISKVTKKKILYAADNTGVISVFHIQNDGSLGEIIQEIKLEGEKGPLSGRAQPGSRPHHLVISKDENYLMIPDKGFDCVHCFRIEADGQLKFMSQIKMRPASCPRHLAFHPNGKWFYVNSEFLSTVTMFRFEQDAGTMCARQIVSTLPDTYVENKNLTSEIAVHPDGRMLYVANRGHDSICVMKINQKTGYLTPVQWVSCEGRKPRFFSVTPDGKQLWCGLQWDDLITIFAIQIDGTLRFLRQIPAATPVWFIFREA